MRRGLDCRNTIENRLAGQLQLVRRRRRIHARAGDPPSMDLHYVNVPAPAGLPMAHSLQHADFVVRRARIGTHDGASAIPRAICAVRTGRRRRHDGLGTVFARWLDNIFIRRFRRAIWPVRGHSGGIPAHWYRHSIHDDLDAHQLPDADHHAEHRMAGACWRIHHRRRVHLAAGFGSACVARQKPAAAHADLRRNHVGRDYCDCRRMQYGQSISRQPPSWHVLLVGRQEKKQIRGNCRYALIHICG